MKIKILRDYDKKNDIMYVNFGGVTTNSLELFDGNLILDLNNEGEIVGFEIMDYIKEVKGFQKKINNFRKVKIK